MLERMCRKSFTLPAAFLKILENAFQNEVSDLDVRRDT